MYSLLLVDCQNDFDEGGMCPREGTRANHIRIVDMIRSVKHKICEIVRTHETLDPHDVTLARNWGFIDNKLEVPVGSIVVMDDFGGYFVDGAAVKYRYVEKNAAKLKIFKSCTKLLPPMLALYSEGWSLTPSISAITIAAQQEFKDVVHHSLKKHHAEGSFEFENQTVPLQSASSILCRDVLVAGESMYMKELMETYIVKVAKQRKTDGLPPLRLHFLSDMITPLPPGVHFSMGWTTSFDVFKMAFNTVGLPPQIHSDPDNVPMSNAYMSGQELFKAKCKWKSMLDTMQTQTPQKKFDGHAILPNGKGCLNFTGLREYISAEAYMDITMKGYGDKLSRDEYNVKHRPKRRSYVELCEGVPPLQNPYGSTLIPGRGKFNWFGPNHTLVVMFVAFPTNATETLRVMFSYSGSYSNSPPNKRDLMCEERMQAMNIPNHNYEFYPGHETHPVCIYEGYMPHQNNTRHAWIEATVMAVELKMLGHDLYHIPQSIETVWMETLNLSLLDRLSLDRKWFRDIIKKWPEDKLKSLVSRHAMLFLEVLGLTSGAKLHRWMDNNCTESEHIHQLLTIETTKNKVIAWINRQTEHKTDSVNHTVEHFVDGISAKFKDDSIWREARDEATFCELLGIQSEDDLKRLEGLETFDEIIAEVNKVKSPIHDILDSLNKQPRTLEWNERSDQHNLMAIMFGTKERFNKICKIKSPEKRVGVANEWFMHHFSKFFHEMSELFGDFCASKEELQSHELSLRFRQHSISENTAEDIYQIRNGKEKQSLVG